MEKWLPIFWIIASGVIFFAVLWLIDIFKRRMSKRVRHVH
jgi:hypothetical protein